MRDRTAENIASLLNFRNKLPEKLSGSQIRDGNYFYIEAEYIKGSPELVACIQAKKLSFFAVELKHLSVNPSYEGKGFAKIMISRVEAFAKESGLPLILATTRPENSAVNHLLKKSGFTPINDFRHHTTQSPLHIWQKMI